MFEGKIIPIYRPNHDRIPFYDLTKVDRRGNPLAEYWIDVTHPENETLATIENTTPTSSFNAVEKVRAYNNEGVSDTVIMKYGIHEMTVAEARAQQSVQHVEQIPTVYGLGTFQAPNMLKPVTTILMEYIPGRIANIAGEQGSYDREILRDPEILGLLINALSGIHDKGFAHLDFVNNILLSFNEDHGVEKVSDLHLIDFDASSPVQKVATTLPKWDRRYGLRGTLWFSSPEHYINTIAALKPTPNSDLYIFALMMYTLFTDGYMLQTDMAASDLHKATIYSNKHHDTIMDEVKKHIPGDFYKKRSLAISAKLRSIFSTALQNDPKLRSIDTPNNLKIPYFALELFTTLGLWDPHK